MLKVRIALVAVILVSLVLAASAALIPVPQLGKAQAAEFYQLMTTLLFIFGLTAGTAMLFMMGLKGFKTSFHHSYRWICLGLILMSVGSLVYPVDLYFLLQGRLTNVVGELPLACAAIFIYWGFVKFARLLQVDSWPTKWPAVVGLLVVATAASWLLPHYPVLSGTELTFDIGHSLLVAELLFYALGGVLAWQIRAVASPAYSRPMIWMSLALWGNFVGTIAYRSFDYIDIPAALSQDLLGLPIILATFLLVVAAYSFNRITHVPVRITPTRNILIDSVILLASLASRPSDLDPILDKMRVITATKSQTDTLSANDIAQLQAAYLEIEDYLITKERLRSFTREDLHTLLEERLGWSADVVLKGAAAA